jgi:hypothetical protein
VHFENKDPIFVKFLLKLWIFFCHIVKKKCNFELWRGLISAPVIEGKKPWFVKIPLILRKNLLNMGAESGRVHMYVTYGLETSWNFILFFESIIGLSARPIIKENFCPFVNLANFTFSRLFYYQALRIVERCCPIDSSCYTLIKLPYLSLLNYMDNLVLKFLA